jgi:hypothetical protein
MATVLAFEPKSDRCFVAFVERDKRALTAVRLILELGGWRIDRCDAVAGAWMPWEPLTDYVYPDSNSARLAAEMLFSSQT